MDYQTISYILLAVLGYASYSAYKLKDQIFCTFRRKDNTLIEKFATNKQARIDFDNGWYDVEPQNIYTQLWTKGIHLIVPTWIRRLDFRWDSSKSLNPRTFTNTWETPEAKKALDKTHAVSQLFAGNRSALAGRGKLSLLEKYQPYIVILGMVGIGYLIYSQGATLQMLVNGLASMQQAIGQLK